MFERDDEILFIGLVLEGFCYGLYSGIFAMYILQYQVSKKDTKNIVFCSICVLYVLSVALFIADIILPTYQYLGKPLDSILHITFIQMALFGCCDFLAQFILIYRCWIVWCRNIHVVIIPSILAFVFLVTWIAGGSSLHIVPGGFSTPSWGYPMTLLGLALSLTVNALVTGLIVFRIFKVFRRIAATSNAQILRAAGGSKLRRTILILIESGIALFSIQLARVVVTIMTTDNAYRAFCVITSIHDMFNGITPTLIVVRTTMGLSFDDEKSMEGVAIGTMRRVSSHPDSVTEMESTTVVDQDSRDYGIGIQRNYNIDIIKHIDIIKQ